MTKALSFRGRAIALAISALLAAAGHAQVDQLVGPAGGGGGLPEARTAFNQRLTYAQPQGGELVTFKSPREGAPGFEIKGVLFKPAGAVSGAVVIVNSGVGWSDMREGHYARSISSAGYAVLAVDSYGPRGIQGTANDNTAISTSEQTRDAFAAKKYLLSLGYPADRIAVMGVDRGGTIALLAADRTFIQGEKEEPFAVAIAVGALCFLHPREPKPSARVFMAIGDKDQVAGVKPCQDLAKEYAAAGGKSTVKVYSGATSGFDGDPANRIMVRNARIETFADCDVVVEPDGRFVYGGKTFAGTNSAALFVEMRKSCSSNGASVYTNVTQKANVTLDLIDFLDANLLR
jgi:dienelactone hydrolase